MSKRKPIRHFVIPDVQAREDVSLDHLKWAGNYIAEKRPDVIVCLGDFADMPSLSSYDKGKRSYEGRRYSADVAAARRGMGLLLRPFKQERRYRPRLILTLGNHEDRIDRAVEDDPKLHGTISIRDLGYTQAGWEVYPFLKPVTIHGVHYSHYFPSGIMGRPCTTARKILTTYHSSCIAGHQQGREVAYAKRGDGRSLTAIITGSFYQHSESYLTPLTNSHWRGCLMLNEVHDGEFDEMWISLGYLKRKYG